MIRRIVAALGRRSFPIAEYGPWHFGDRVTVYVGRRWSWHGKKRSWTSPEGVRSVWYSALPAQVHVRVSRKSWVTVKVEIGTLLICYDLRPYLSYTGTWLADRAEVDEARWSGWRLT